MSCQPMHVLLMCHNWGFLQCCTSAEEKLPGAAKLPDGGGQGVSGCCEGRRGGLPAVIFVWRSIRVAQPDKLGCIASSFAGLAQP